MTRLKRRTLIFVLALAGLAALPIFLHNFRARQALAARKAELVAQGEKLSVEELMPPSSPDARRAANDLMQAAWQLRQGSVVPNNLPKSMMFVSPGKASVGWKQSGIRDDKKTNTWDELAEHVDMNAAALEQIREALKTPRLDMNLNYKMGSGLLLPHLAKLKGVAQWLSAATMSELHAARLNEAATNLNGLISLADAFREERLIISQLVRMAITAIAISPTWEALQADGWTDAQLPSCRKTGSHWNFCSPWNTLWRWNARWALKRSIVCEIQMPNADNFSTETFRAAAVVRRWRRPPASPKCPSSLWNGPRNTCRR